jgi:hypothetical protein
MHYKVTYASAPESCCDARHHLSPLRKQQQSTGVEVEPVQHVRLGIGLVPRLPLLLLLLLYASWAISRCCCCSSSSGASEVAQQQVDHAATLPPASAGTRR